MGNRLVRRPPVKVSLPGEVPPGGTPIGLVTAWTPRPVRDKLDTLLIPEVTSVEPMPNPVSTIFFMGIDWSKMTLEGVEPERPPRFRGPIRLAPFDPLW